VESPVQKYKGVSSLDKRSLFKLKDVMNKSPPKVKNSFGSKIAGSNHVLDRLRVSQRMIEEREIKLKKNIVP
jgi:hypothetical protein